MKHAEPKELASLVEQIFDASPFANQFSGVDIAPGRLDDEADFIRVLVRLAKLDELSEEDADALTIDIERKISERDDRFTSIRFSAP